MKTLEKLFVLKRFICHNIVDRLPKPARVDRWLAGELVECWSQLGQTEGQPCHPVHVENRNFAERYLPKITKILPKFRKIS